MSILNHLEKWQAPLTMPAPPLKERAIPFVLAVANVFKWVLLVRLSLEGLAAVIMAFNPYFYKLVIDSMEGVTMAGPIGAASKHALVLYVVVVLILTLLVEYLSNLVKMVNLETSITPLVRNWLYSRQLEHSLAVFQDTFAGSLANQVGEAARATNQLVSNATGNFVWSPFIIVTSLYLFWHAHYLLILPLLVWSVIYLLLQFPQVMKLDKLSAAAAEIRSRVMGYMVDTFSNIVTVKLFANLEHERSGIGQELKQERRNELALQWGYFRLHFTNGMLESLLDGATLILAVWLRYRQLITTGDVVMAVSLVQVIRGNLKFLTDQFSTVLEARGQLQQALNQLMLPFTVVDTPAAQPLTTPHGQLTFTNVSFRYGPTTPVVMQNLNLIIPAGQRVGLVGPSGSGKSTLVNLLLRFYDVTEGTITADAHNIREVTQNSLRSHIGMVTQDTSLLHRSIAENIAYGKPGATMEEIIAAARKAHADSFITTLADKDGNTGYNCKVGERGVKLSGGQRQRIAIARLILKNAPILILDEATSALDSEAEVAIQENLATLMEGKTVIAIAHRLSTIAKLDRLIVLEDGRIVEDGTHEQLINKKGLYARLWSHQSGGFLQNE